jgi:hypothetical protein
MNWLVLWNHQLLHVRYLVGGVQFLGKAVGLEA